MGFHIKHKLFKKGTADWEGLDGSFAQLIDANFPAMRGSVRRTEAINKLYPQWKNEEFQELVKQVRTTNEPQFTDAVFFLYDLAGNGADQLIDTLKLVKRKAAADGRSHDARMIMAGASSGTTILSAPSPRELSEKMLVLTKIAKYKSKANTWLALGCVAGSDRLVDAIAFSKAPWNADPVLEDLAKHFKGKLKTQSGRKIGRNEKCPCSSGKKFKYCHGAN